MNAARKTRLISEAPLLASCLAYYLNRTNEWCEEPECELTRKEKRHLHGARLLIGTYHHRNEWGFRGCVISKGWEARVEHILGLDLRRYIGRDAYLFYSMPDDLTIDGSVYDFTWAHPDLLDRAKAYLRKWLEKELNNHLTG